MLGRIRFLSLAVRVVLPVLLLVAFAGMQPASAASPPLTLEAKVKLADAIIVGKIEKIASTEIVQMAGFSNLLLRIEVKVISADKGVVDARGAAPIVVHAWQAKLRPRDFDGPTGLAGVPAVGSLVRIYLQREADGKLVVLVPNGIDLLPR